MSDKDTKTFWMYTKVEETLHTALLEISTAMGKHPSAVIEIAIEEFVIDWVQNRTDNGEPVSPNADLERMILLNRKRQGQLHMLKQLAYDYMASPTEEEGEQLQKICDIVGISLEGLLESIAGKAHIVDLTSNGNKLSDVELFLAEYMTPGQPYSAVEIREEGERRGFKKYLVEEAKRKLRIKSQKDGKNWTWIFPETMPEDDYEPAQEIF